MTTELFNPQPYLDNAVLIESTADLAQFLTDVADTDLMAVDTESAGFYKYKSVTNLIQVCTRKRAALFDPQKIEDFEPLREFARNSSCEWIFHGSDYDVRVLSRDVGLEITRLFDTRVASELLGLKELGLSALSEKYLGGPLDKKLQRCDWSRRPLTPAMRTYGLLDAISLIPIRDILHAELVRTGRLNWAMEEFSHLAQQRWEGGSGEPDPTSYIIKGASHFPPRALAVLREVWMFREAIATRLDRASFMVLPNPALLEIARQAPRSQAGLSVIKHINRDFLTRYGRELQEAIVRGLSADIDQLPLPSRHSGPRQNFLTAWEGELAKTLRERRNEVAAQIGLAASLLASGESLDNLAKDRPGTLEELHAHGVLRHWQVELLAEAFLPLLQREAPAGVRRRRRRGGRSRAPINPGA